LEAIWYTIAAIILYLVSDRILNYAELRAGRRFERRTLIFFGILLTLAIITFWLARQILAPAASP